MTNNNSSLQFWKNFQKPTRNLYLFSLIILAISLTIFGLAYFRGLDNVIHWDVLSELNDLPIVLDDETAAQAWSATIQLAERHRLTVYDAAYLELAQRRGLPLASLDQELRTAAEVAGVALVDLAT